MPDSREATSQFRLGEPEPPTTAIQGFLGGFFPDLEVHLISSLQDF